MLRNPKYWRQAARYAILTMFTIFFATTNNYGLLVGAVALVADELLQ